MRRIGMAAVISVSTASAQEKSTEFFKLTLPTAHTTQFIKTTTNVPPKYINASRNRANIKRDLLLPSRAHRTHCPIAKTNRTLSKTIIGNQHAKASLWMLMKKQPES